MTKGIWERNKNLSRYHFDTSKIDLRWDTNRGLTPFKGDWSKELDQAITAAKPVTWATKKFKYWDKPLDASGVLHEAEQYDLINAGADPEQPIVRVLEDIPDIFCKMESVIGLSRAKTRLQIQFPGEVFINHFDTFNNGGEWPEDGLTRIIVMLTDWQQGQFFQYGNFMYKSWRAGDASNFDWRNVPHATANASHTPRALLVTTGNITDQTKRWIEHGVYNQYWEI